MITDSKSKPGFLANISPPLALRISHDGKPGRSVLNCHIVQNSRTGGTRGKDPFPFVVYKRIAGDRRIGRFYPYRCSPNLRVGDRNAPQLGIILHPECDILTGKGGTEKATTARHQNAAALAGFIAQNSYATGNHQRKFLPCRRTVSSQRELNRCPGAGLLQGTGDGLKRSSLGSAATIITRGGINVEDGRS